MTEYEEFIKGYAEPYENQEQSFNDNVSLNFIKIFLIYIYILIFIYTII